MIYTKVDPQGIDKQIQRIQQFLYDKLNSVYSGEIYSYGRVYKNETENGVRPLFYVGNKDYEELTINDTINGLHYFFVEDDKSEISDRVCISSNEVDIIFIIDDITKIRGDISHYADEEIKETIKSYVQGLNFSLTSVTKGKKALDGFDISKTKFIFPYFVFKLTGTINNY
ncbi:MAG: hypothetical protein QM490_06105 [Candidatus Gracilibacteria bacterium]